MKYPKINTLWKRDKKDKFNIIIGDYACEEFSSISRWHITEKIDGTNIRILYDGKEPVFYGRTDEAQIPPFLLDYLKKTFTKELLSKQFPEIKKGVVLYGEGYGNKIQSVGKKYRKDNSFILFDAWIDGWWLEPEKVKQLAKDLGLDYVPELGIVNTIQEAIDYLKKKPKSKIAKEELIIEGIVARSYPLMLFRDGTPIMWKLKVKDYTKLEQGGKQDSEKIKTKKGTIRKKRR